MGSATPSDTSDRLSDDFALWGSAIRCLPSCFCSLTGTPVPKGTALLMLIRQVPGLLFSCLRWLNIHAAGMAVWGALHEKCCPTGSVEATPGTAAA